ncbi:activating transcription factor 4b isoform X2 [Echeneis naucrates]|uniref:activating transcription factor 4b isoform X2 n=1 Tax=Echeneis naucrates TaxID=173247 RepID=UPI001113A1E9|nr:cyclic AMP-dependent transcription factor ATF-4-like isoform X2 [Echeneis naucrates]
MTMMMTNSQFGLEDMEALLWGPSSPMADAVGSLFFNPDQEEHPEGGGPSQEGDTSPVSPLTSSSLSSSSSPPPFYSPPPSPPAVLLHGDKAGNESGLLSVPLLGHPDQLRCSQTVSDDRKEEMFCDLDWMAEKMDLSEFDLESLIGSCSPPEESASSTEDLLASLDCQMELASFPTPTLSTPPSPSAAVVCSEDASIITVDDTESHIDGQGVPSPPPCVPEPQEELEIKSEPASPDPSPPLFESPSSPVYTLDLGSEVDVSESEVKPVLATVGSQVPRIVLSLSPTRIVLVLAPKNEVGITTTTVATTSDVIHTSPPAAPPQRSSRSRPYPDLKYKASPPSPSAESVKVKSMRGSGVEEKVTLKAPKDKKLKKMEQNKTAATRYRQKKRAEQDALTAEHTLLERRNMELVEKAESLAREIEYLKELMEEVRLARINKGLSADP